MNWKMNAVSWAVGCVIVAGGVGCEKKEAAPPAAASAAKPSEALPSGLMLTAAPSDAKPVEEVKASAKVGDTVAVRGRIGGSHEPFVAGRAVFTLVGPGLKSCSENPDDKCATPWDYCCEPAKDIAAHSATIQVVNAAGAPVKADIKGQNGIKELSDLIIVGKVAQADAGTLVVNATGVYVATP